MKPLNSTNRIWIMFLLSVLTLGVQAQVTIVDGHYVDPKQGMEANPTGNPDWSLVQGTVKKAVKGKRNAPIAPATSYGLPDHVNNGANKYFRSPVANQSGNSCGITSRHSHMMAYELNAYRDKDGSLAENMLPAHFAFVPAYREDPNKENYAKYVGIPDGATFGGTNVSSIYGGPYSESSNNYGRMQGYENWHKAMFNRITDNPNFPTYTLTEAGALAWKRWLYNHNGDDSFHAGGVIGIGCASSGLEYAAIPSTTANDNAGVTGLYYLTHWGTGVDHAMTVVGYDDRIEFDLDGDGTYGSSSNNFGQNEMGAWIVANSWGSGWCNNGFIYVPYALASPTSTSKSVTVGNYSWNQKTYTGYVAGDANGWNGEIYKIRKDYTPIRTLKAAVAYSKRSEIQICVGISTNLNATSPDKTLVLANHNYHGDYDSDGTDAEVPMLGQWTDGKLHTEAMEFGYDLTDFTDEFDRHVPLKYFLIIKTKSGASGTGKIEYASIMDYELNANGVETPFASKNVTITNNGGTTTISTIVYGEELPAPANLALNSTTLSWDAPQGAGYTPTGYNIYQDGAYVANTTSRSYNIGAATGSFYVTACYTVNDVSSESSASNIVTNNVPSGNFISYIGDPITAVSQLTSGMYVVLKCTGNRNKYVYDNGSSNVYPITSEAPDILDTNDYKYVFKVGKSGNYYTFQSLNGYLPALSNSMKPSTTAGNYTVEQISGSTNLFSLQSSGSSYYLNGGESSITQYYMDLNCKFLIIPVNVSITSSNALNVSITHPATVYTGVPVQLGLEGAADIVSATWAVDGTNYSGLSPYVTFSSAGTKSVSCTATDSKNHSKTVTKTITVTAPTVTANFTLSSESTTGSDRISFLSQNMVPGCTYSWSMPGAEEETATTRNASATYTSTGEKTVTLTVTDPNNNSVSHSETFMVNASTPKPRYTISPAIVVKGNSVSLTDNSLYNPTSWSWRFDSDNNRISCTTQNGTITPTKAGVYKLTFGTGNAEGSDFIEAERALIVCNSASGNGLTFAGGNQNVTATMSSALTTAWTIDFWFNPSSLGATTQGITGSNSNSFTITSNASGVATLSVGSNNVSTDQAFYIANEWHHYAITFERDGTLSTTGTVKFYRDGSLISSKSVSTSSFSTYFKTIQLGGSSAPLSGSIDEFRVWSTTLTQENIRSYCVAPISASTSGLKLYWQMNQSSGNVTDATSNGVTGTRNNFNNDGDAWSDSEGVFALDFSDPSNPTISDSQLNHYYDNVYSVTDEQDGNYQRGSLGLAFDGNTSTFYQSRWESGGYSSEVGYPHSFILRRGALHEITAFDIVASSTPTNTLYSGLDASCGRAKYVTIEESDDATNWNYVDKEVRLFDLGTNNVVLPRPITKEYVRFTFSEPLYNDRLYAALLINEMNFYGTAVEPVKTEVPLTYVACSDESTTSGDVHLGSEALDNNSSTFWHSSWYGTPVAYPHTITIENADLSGIDMFYFYQQHSASSNQNGEFRAAEVNVETSSDNSSWTTAFEGLRIPYGADGYVKLPATINDQYIRLTFTRNETTVKGSSNDNGTFLAMNEIEAYSVRSSVTVTWNVVDADNHVKYSVNKTCSEGVQISSYPDELRALEEKYVQLEALTPFTPTSNMTKTVHCTYNTPFTVSDDVTTYYYNLAFVDYTQYYYGNTNCFFNLLSATTGTDDALTMVANADGSDTQYQWAFYGNPFDGFTIKNRSTGNTLYHNNALTNGGVPVLLDANATTWTALKSTHDGSGASTNVSDIATAYESAMTLSSSSFFLMNYGNTKLLKFYTNAQADKFAGIKVTLADTQTLTYNTITWNVVDENDNVLYTVDKTYTTGTEVTAYPTELTDWAASYADYFVALPSLTSFTVAADGEKNVLYEWTGPFQFSTDTEKHLYSINNTYYGYLYTSNTIDERVYCNTSLVNCNGRWAWMFKGNPFDGIQIISYYDKSTGLAAGFGSEYGKRKSTPTTYFIMQGSASGNIVISNALGSDDVLVSYPYDGDGKPKAIYHNAGSGKSQWNGQFTLSEIDESIIVKSGYYRVRGMGSGLTSKYWKLDDQNGVKKLWNDGSADDMNTIFRFEEQVNASNGLPTYYIAGFYGTEAWYLDNTRTDRSQQFTATQTEGNYMPAEIIYNGKSGDIPFYAIKLSNQTNNSSQSYANTNTGINSVVTWGYTSGTVDGSAWTFEPVDFFEATATDIYTVNNTNTSRGALTSDPSNSAKFVWSSGKGGATAFDASSADCQWIFVPTSEENLYCLYTVGKQKFIVPTQSGEYGGYSWMFSSDAVPLKVFPTSDGTYKICTISDNIYLSVSNNYSAPIINYNDVGARFTLTKQGAASSEVTSQLTTALMAVPPASKPMTLNAVGAKSYATLYLDYDAQTDANTKAYYITSTENGYAKLTEVANEGRNIPAYTAVVLVNENGTTNPTFTTGFANSSGFVSAVEEGTNLLKGTLTSMELDLSDATNYYSMGKKDNKIGFYKFSGGTITLGANKAYLETPAPVGAVKGFVFDIDDDPDAIGEINGQWSMVNGGSIYNLSGQRLGKPQRGINIINGKKVIIK